MRTPYNKVVQTHYQILLVQLPSAILHTYHYMFLNEKIVKNKLWLIKASGSKNKWTNSAATEKVTKGINYDL